MTCRNCGRGQMAAQVQEPRQALANGPLPDGPTLVCSTCGQEETRSGVVVRAGRSIGLMRASSPPGISRR